MASSKYGPGEPGKRLWNKNKPVSKAAYERLVKLDPELAATKYATTKPSEYSDSINLRERFKTEETPEGNLKRGRRSTIRVVR